MRTASPMADVLLDPSNVEGGEDPSDMKHTDILIPPSGWRLVGVIAQQHDSPMSAVDQLASQVLRGIFFRRCDDHEIVR